MGEIVLDKIGVVLVRKKRQITVSGLPAVAAPTLKISLSHLFPPWSSTSRFAVMGQREAEPLA